MKEFAGHRKSQQRSQLRFDLEVEPQEVARPRDFPAVGSGWKLKRSWRCATLIFFLLLLAREASAKADVPFGFSEVTEQAGRLAAEPFKAPPAIPDFLARLSYDEYRDIRFDTAQSLWKDAGGTFEVQFIHPGALFRHAVVINTIDRTGVRPVPFSPALFTYGRNAIADKVPADLGFAGFRITYPFNKKDEKNHVLVFAGASYFRGVAKGEVFGLSMRGVAIDTGLASGEEFPFFREFWLKR